MKFFAFSVFLAPSIAFAQLPHTVDMTVPIHDEYGRPIRECTQQSDDGKTCLSYETLTVGGAIATSLVATFPDERGLDGDQKWARGILAERVKKQKAAQLSAEEAALIKKVVGKAFGSVVVAQVYPVIDPNAKPPKIEP